MVGGILLAAGESSRMGFPKPLLLYKGITFLEHLLSVLRGQVEPLVLVLGHEAERIRSATAILPQVRVVVNHDYRLGQLSSLQAGLRELEATPAQGAGRPPASALCWPDAALVALVDHPCIERDLVSLLVRAFEQERPAVLIPTYRGRRGHPMIFSSQLFPELLEAPLDQGARWVVRRNQPRELPVECEGILLDLDDPETYRRVTGSPVP